MQHLITKFGGTSVSSLETWTHILNITRQHLTEDVRPIIVCSAMTQISNQLEQITEAALVDQHHSLLLDIQQKHQRLADELQVPLACIALELEQLNKWLTGIALLKEASAKTKAQILSLGELMMTRLGHAFLQQNEVDCHWLNVKEALCAHPMEHVGEAQNYLSACCDSDKDPQLQQKLWAIPAKVIITQGFFAANPEGETVLLGRGGSDTSAALLAAKLEAKCCEIWTDVPGIYTANPHQQPEARLLKQLHYNEAQEIASMGAKVLHPNCIPPVRAANIPMVVKFTRMPQHIGTRIDSESDELAPPIKSIQVKHSITLISIDTLSMWQQVGFLADVFSTFKQHEFSVDLLSSSEFNVTLSLDSSAKLKNRDKLTALIADLNHFGRARVIEPCSAVSLVGQGIRTVLPKLGPALEVFESKQIHLMSLASNDLNLTFVVDESHAEKLCQQLHHLLIETNQQSFYYSKSWQEEFGIPSQAIPAWWQTKKDQLLDLAATESPCYIYDKSTLITKTKELLQLQSIDAIFYAMKANAHPDIIRSVYDEGINIECVSIHELQYVLEHIPQIDPKRLLFTPNFASKTEYAFAIQLGCHLTIDNLHPLQHWPDILANQSIILRVDPGSGAGHHKFVSTAGSQSKFGITLQDLPLVSELVAQHSIQIKGLHAHSGSGILTPDLWQDTAQLLTQLIQRFPDISIINLGGGLGVVEKPGQMPLNLAEMDDALLTIKAQFPNLSFWLEPGRYFVADCGVILAKVTQCKDKGKVQFIGIETGMNSLIRPALYGAFHEIVNLSQYAMDKTCLAHVVGPICESGDTLGYNRLLPKTVENDVLLIAKTGAYGYCMSSHYNLRPPAKEIMLD